MRNMSFALTTEALLAGRKTVTRRRGWWFLKPGDRLCAVEKAQGLKKGEKVKRLAELEVVSTREERLCDISADDVRREGFEDMRRFDFIEMFRREMRCNYGAIVNRIEFQVVKFLPKARGAMK